MRLFVGVEVTDAVRAMAERAAADLAAALPPNLQARWIPVENLHLTVRFIGHVADEKVKEVAHALAPAIPVSPFDVELSECGRFPLNGAPRVLWIGITRGLSQLANTHDECNRRLRLLGYEAEGRVFTAHLTLARVKDAPPGSGRAVQQALSAVATEAVHFTVDHVTLFESQLSPNGARYATLLHVPLEAGSR
jgi:RNA 2',3'-cyclic 3'-phosphodiesterase